MKTRHHSQQNTRPTKPYGETKRGKVANNLEAHQISKNTPVVDTTRQNKRFHKQGTTGSGEDALKRPWDIWYENRIKEGKTQALKDELYFLGKWLSWFPKEKGCKCCEAHQTKAEERHKEIKSQLSNKKLGEE